MNKTHFLLRRRYRAIMKDGTTIDINLYPETCYFFAEQETKYLIRAIRKQEDLDINQVDRIETYFVPIESEKEVEFYIGV